MLYRSNEGASIGTEATLTLGERVGEIEQTARCPEIVGVVIVTVLYLFLRLWGLRDAALNRSFDEGVHLGLMQVVAKQHATLYKDALFIHPPGVILAGARLWPLVKGDVCTLRALYVVFCSLYILPTYAIARKLFGWKTALGTLLLLAVTPGFCGWLGRTIMLEPPLMVFLYAALWLLICRPSSVSSAAAGICVGAGFVVKETALLMGFALIAVLLWDSVGRRSKKPFELSVFPAATWLCFATGFGVASALVMLRLLHYPHFWNDVAALNARDPYRFTGRLYELQNGFFQLPIQMTVGVAGLSALLRSPHREPRVLGWFAIVCGVLTAVLAHRLFWRHLLCIMPICTMAAVHLIATSVNEKGRGISLSRSVRLGRAVLLPACLVNVVTLVLYFGRERVLFTSYREAEAVLQQQASPVFTYDPLWVVAAQREFPRWEYAVDSVYARQYGMATDQDVLAVLRQCPTVLLDRNVYRECSRPILAALSAEYRPIYVHGVPDDVDYVAVLKRIP